MCYVTTAWAFTVVGTDRMSKHVLLHLTNFRNSRTGKCDPSQATLARACGMGISSLNKHLSKLEKLGLIKRKRRLNPKTGANMSTQYDFPQGPSQLAQDGIEVIEA